MKHKKIAQQTGSPSKSRWNFVAEFWPTFLAIVGTFILGYATVLQLTRAPEIEETRNRLQRSQLIVDITEGQRDQWLIALNQELTRDKPNKSMLAEAAFESIQASARWRSYLAMRVANSQDAYRSAISEREGIISKAEGLKESGDTEGLLRMNREFTAAMKNRRELGQYDDRFFSNVYEAEAMSARISSRIATSYILGSVIMLISSVAYTVQSNQLLKKIESGCP